MELEEAQVDETKPRSRAGRVIALLRVLIAWGGTLTFLPYTWARTIVFIMSDGVPEFEFVAMLLTAVSVLALLTWGVARKFSNPRIGYWIMAGVIASWLAMNVLLIWMRAGTLIPRLMLLPIFLPATLFVVWVAWFGFLPLNWPKRLIITAVTALLVAPFFAVYRVAGLTGDGRVDFAYRSTPPRKYVTPERPILDDDQSNGEGELIAQPGDSPDFMGPERNGVYPDVKLMRDWGAQPPQLLWRIPVGAGWGSFSIVNDRALTQEQRGDKECVVCYDLETGSEIWRHEESANYDSALGGPGPRGTPTVRENRVYTLGATGILNCLDGATGDAIWTSQVINEADNLQYGTSASPLVTDQFVMVGKTSKQGPSLVAFDRATGSPVFAEGNQRVSYCSPRLATVDGVSQILNGTMRGLISHDPQTGKVLWKHAFANDNKVNATQPLLVPGRDDQIFLSTGYGKGSTLLTVKQSDSGEWDVQTEWTSRKMATKFTTAVIVDDYVYGLDNGIFACVSLKDGKQAWKKGRYGHGQIILLGDLILVQAEKGYLALVEPNPENLVELSRVDALPGKTWNVPAYAHGKLIVRNDQEAICFELPLVEE